MPLAKSIRSLLVISFCLLLGAVLLAGCSRFLASPAPVFPHQVSDLSPDPALRTGVLENGFRYVLLPNNRPQNRVNLHLVIAAGSFHEKKEERGLAHYLEHMLFNGTTHFPPGELVKYFQSIGMRFGNDANASTGFLQTVYDLDLPAGDRQSLAKGLLVMSDYARGALLKESEVDKERNIILAEKRTRDSVAYRTFQAELGFELAGSRIVRRYPIGTEEVIRAADSDLLRGYYDAWYRPEKLTLVMVGQFSPAVAEELIREQFSSMSARAPERPVPDYGQTRHTGLNILYHYEKEAGGTEVTLETLVQEPPPTDTAAEREQELVRDLAYRILNYRLDKLTESPDPPFTGASAQAGRAFRQYRYASLSASCLPGKWADSLTALEQVLRRALAHGFTRAEVERVRKEVLAELDRAVKQKDTRESGALARQIMHDLFVDRVFLSPEQRQRLLAPVVEELTAEKLHQALRQTWQPEGRLVMVTGNARIEPPEQSAEEKIRSVFTNSQARPVKPPPDKEITSFPYLPEPQNSGSIKERRAEEDIGITRIDFANGVRLNFKKTDFKANQVLVKVGFGEGESAEPADRPALSELGADVINQSGFGRLTREELLQALAGKKATISLSVADDRFYLNGYCATDEVSLLFQLLHTFYHDFGCRSDARQRVLAGYDRQYDELTHTIGGAMALSGVRFFAGGDSRFGLPPERDAFEEVSLEEIRGWMHRALRQEAPEISVVGDFEPDEMITAVADYFGSMSLWEKGPPGENGKTADRRGPVFPSGRTLELRVPTKIDKAFVNVGWPTDDYWDIHQTRRLSVLADIFSDRMRRTIREEFGHTYSQYAYNRLSKAYNGYGAFHAAAEVAPADSRAVLDRIRGIAADIIDKGVTDEELTRAREPIINHIKKTVKTNTYWLNSVLTGSRRHPEKLDWCRNFLDDYAAITSAEVTRLARQYLDNTDAAEVVIQPEKDGE
ncbi:MAG: M16 family metallopeptidase [Desulfosudaceae bacterium]